MNKPFLVELQVMENVVSFEVNTGTAVSIISEDNFRYHFPNESISKSTLQLKTYTKDQLPVIREVKVPVSYNNQKENFVCCTSQLLLHIKLTKYEFMIFLNTDINHI